MNCRICGAPLDTEASFCPKCGATAPSLTASEPCEPEASETSEPALTEAEPASPFLDRKKHTPKPVFAEARTPEPDPTSPFLDTGKHALIEAPESVFLPPDAPEEEPESPQVIVSEPEPEPEQTYEPEPEKASPFLDTGKHAPVDAQESVFLPPDAPEEEPESTQGIESEPEPEPEQTYEPEFEKASPFLDTGKHAPVDAQESVFLPQDAPETEPGNPPASPFSELPASEPDVHAGPSGPAKRIRLSKKARIAVLIGAGLLLAAALMLVILTSVPRGKKTTGNSPEDIKTAVLSALQAGDGAQLAALAKTAEPLLGAHPESFGEGDTPEAVMLGYYSRLAGGLRRQLVEWYGEEFRLAAELKTELHSGSEISSENSALDLEADQYAVMTGPLTADGNIVSDIRIVAAKTGSEWKLLVVYLY